MSFQSSVSELVGASGLRGFSGRNTHTRDMLNDLVLIRIDGDLGRPDLL